MKTAADSLLPLDYIGIEEGTDKTSLIGDYLARYERIMTPLKDAAFNFIEIGVLNGASLRTWERFLTRATLVGVDIDPKCSTYERDRIKIVVGSQDDPVLLHRLVADYPPLVIIDDGSHRSDHIIFTFERLFPLLLPDGYYIVEDMHFHLLEQDRDRLKGRSPSYATDYFLELARMHMGGTHVWRTLEGLNKYLIDAIDEIRFVPQAVIIHKKAPGAGLGERLPEIKTHVPQTADWLTWLALAMRLHENGYPDSDVIPALQRAAERNSGVGVIYERLSEALERSGDIAAASEALDRAIALSANRPDLIAVLNDRLGRLTARGAR